jgi:hypothetical protein
MKRPELNRCERITARATLLEQLGQDELRKYAPYKDSVQTKHRPLYLRYHQAKEMIRMAKQLRDMR